MESNEFLKLINEDQTVNKEVYELSDDKFYEHFSFEKSIDSWSDFLQQKFNHKSINEVKQIDLEMNNADNYLVGMDFFNDNKGFKNYYLDAFEDSLRMQLEDCDLVQTLHFNIDFSSVWGGISNHFITEIVCNELPKVQKVIQGIDDNNIFSLVDPENPGMKVPNMKKLMNYLYYFSDLIEVQQTMLFNPIKAFEDVIFFEKLYNYNAFDTSLSCGANNFFTSSLAGVDLVNFTLPSRNKYSKGRHVDLTNTLYQNNTINFYHSDISYHLPEEINYNSSNKKFFNNGVLFSYNKNMKKQMPIADFNWDKHFSYLTKTKRSTFSVAQGYNEKLRLMSSPIDKFLNILSSSNFSSISPIPIPFCYPRSVSLNSSKLFLNDCSLLSLYSHDYLYYNNFIDVIPKFVKENAFSVEKYLRKLDIGKYMELSDRIESLFHLSDFYENFKSFNDDDEDECLDY